MIFDVFHSLGRVDSLPKPFTDQDVFREFFRQVKLAEQLEFSMIWVAESHFSSEVQKKNSYPVIPHYEGEVGLNTDSFQLATWIQNITSKIGFGTAITNIVGGNGGPIAVADRVRSLAWHNLYVTEKPRSLAIGLASGRFPYINRPFGIVPQNELEKILWPTIQKYIFLEALEIFIRLSQNEILSSDEVTEWWIDLSTVSEDQWLRLEKNRSSFGELELKITDKKILYKPRWQFEQLKLVPEIQNEDLHKHLRFVLGSHEPRARELGLKFTNLDIFNLSFTPPQEIEKTHADMARLIDSYKNDPTVQIDLKPWQRSRMPRTVLVFIDKDSRQAKQRAEAAIETYRKAMAGTVQLPHTDELLSRALVGSPEEIIDQLHPDSPHGFHQNDRLMLWFEFNQSDGDAIIRQMRLFAEKVMPKWALHNDSKN